MSARTVAEVLGWQRVEHIGWEGEIEGHEWVTTDGRNMGSQALPTVDDMLAWLRERAGVVMSGGYRHVGDVRVTLITRTTRAPFTAPTLHAALEAAVLAAEEVQP